MYTLFVFQYATWRSNITYIFQPVNSIPAVIEHRIHYSVQKIQLYKMKYSKTEKY
jgi:hypothetical protein